MLLKSSPSHSSHASGVDKVTVTAPLLIYINLEDHLLRAVTEMKKSVKKIIKCDRKHDNCGDS